MKNLFIIFLYTFSIISINSLQGTLYNSESKEKEILYYQEIGENKEENYILHEYYNTDGLLSAFEKYTIGDNNFDIYDFGILSQNKIGQIKIFSDIVEITFTDDKKVKNKIKKYKGEIVTGPTMDKFIIENFNTFLNGDEAVALIPSFDFLTLIPFRFIPKFQKENQLIITMKLKNFILGRLIDPVDFVYSITEKELLEIHGPTVLPVPNTKSNKFVNADIYYSRGDINE